MHRTISYHKQRLKQLEKSYKSLSQKIISEYPEKSHYVKSLLSTKHEKLHQDPVKRRHCKFFGDGIEGSYFKECCHEIERKSLNVITGYSNDSVEPQELFNNIHHTIILTNDASQISPFIKALCGKGPSFAPAPINYGWAQLQLDFDAFASGMRPRYMFRGKGSPPRNGSSIHCYPRKHLLGEHVQQTLLSWKHFYQQLKRDYLVTSNEITLNITLLKMDEDL